CPDDLATARLEDAGFRRIRCREANPAPAISQVWRCLSLLRVPGCGLSGIPRGGIQRELLPCAYPRPFPLRSPRKTPRRLARQDVLHRTLTLRLHVPPLIRYPDRPPT